MKPTSISSRVAVSIIGLLASAASLAADAGSSLSPNIGVTTRGNSDANGRLFYTDYDSIRDLRSVRPVWQAEQEPRSPGLEGEVQTDRIQVVTAQAVPGDGPRKPTGAVMRVELRPWVSADGHPGDRNSSGKSNRSEVYARHAVPGSTPPERWADPVDSTRWYGVSVFVPTDFETDPRKWFTFTQWKGYMTGSPPVALEIKGEHFEIGGIKRHRLGPIEKGSWTNFVVGIHLSPDAQVGWINVYKNGVEIVRRTSQATMKVNKIGGNTWPDPNYLKQGIYRDKGWTVTHVLYFGPTTIATSRDSLESYLR